MNRLVTSAGWLPVVLALTMPVYAGGPSHADRIATYEGAKTCAPCHKEVAGEVAASLHYQQQAEPQFLAGWEKGKPAGMMKSY